MGARSTELDGTQRVAAKQVVHVLREIPQPSGEHSVRSRNCSAGDVPALGLHAVSWSNWGAPAKRTGRAQPIRKGGERVLPSSRDDRFAVAGQTIGNKRLTVIH